MSDSNNATDSSLDAIAQDQRLVDAILTDPLSRKDPEDWSVKLHIPRTESNGGRFEAAASVIGNVHGNVVYNFGWLIEDVPGMHSSSYAEQGKLWTDTFYEFCLNDPFTYIIYVEAVDEIGEVSRATARYTVLGESPLTRPGLPSDDAETVIAVNDVSMIFNIASEQFNSLKEYFLALASHELRFKEFRALDHISFEVKRGEAFGLVGTNGSGKSTMLKIIAGVLEASEGSCTVTGTIAPLIELGAGFDPELTAKENIYLNGALLGYRKEFIDEHFDDIVAFAELENFMDMPLKNYSSGMVARIAFAIATITEPDILIVDETLSVGDFLFQRKCEQRIKELVEADGVTVLLVSHSIDLVERMCDRVCWIEKGHQRMLGPTDDICAAYRALEG